MQLSKNMQSLSRSILLMLIWLKSGVGARAIKSGNYTAHHRPGLQRNARYIFCVSCVRLKSARRSPPARIISGGGGSTCGEKTAISSVLLLLLLLLGSALYTKDRERFGGRESKSEGAFIRKITLTLFQSAFITRIAMQIKMTRDTASRFHASPVLCCHTKYWVKKF
jgi:hypothetical protein